jgi:hypothetical protein
MRLRCEISGCQSTVIQTIRIKQEVSFHYYCLEHRVLPPLNIVAEEYRWQGRLGDWEKIDPHRFELRN